MKVVRKVTIMQDFTADATPTNSMSWNIPVNKDYCIIPWQEMTTQQRLDYDQVAFRMQVQRALLRGNGFFDVLVKYKTPAEMSDALRHG
ncbi:hypothetical protein FOVG_18113 [Fusarium oxysporum f. sp. pisi HDV247]|uniref:Uncharacterized protein n=1 Tax=Fusarium oxysporum f. sp. pisi HDV247 TaxID=1080344 RepID=W9NCV5_FUSOX|nr:hypothetical protein FOVG_18113 [Fusarium oxysporum f. sp. pisi HDV247]